MEINTGDTVHFTHYGAHRTGTVSRISTDGAIIFLTDGRWLHRESITLVA